MPFQRVSTREKISAVVAKGDRSRVGLHRITVAHEEAPVGKPGGRGEAALKQVDCPACPVVVGGF